MHGNNKAGQLHRQCTDNIVDSCRASLQITEKAISIEPILYDDDDDDEYKLYKKTATKPTSRVTLYHIQHFDTIHTTPQHSAIVLISSTAVQNCRTKCQQYENVIVTAKSTILSAYKLTALPINIQQFQQTESLSVQRNYY